MRIRPYAEFTSDLPEDHIENDDGEIVQYGGKSVAEAIAELLRRLGCEVAPPIHAFEHGWEIDARYGKRRLWGQVTLIEGYIFIFEDPMWFPKMFGRQHPVYIDMLRRLAVEMANDPRFQRVRWHFSRTVLSGSEGAKEPISE